MSSAQAYPLQWPDGTPRTPAARRIRSQFAKRDWNKSLKDLRYELERMGAFTGFKALPAQAGQGEDWRIVLALDDNATLEQIKNAHRLAAASAHPDRGGSSDQMARINTARDRALAELERAR